jgi:uncharacterized protein (TIGR03089 family)
MTSASQEARRSLLAPLVDGDPRLPRLVVYTDDGRTELSGASLGNWTAKVAGLLRDELAAAPGDVVAALLPTGWQGAPVLLGAWWCGLTVTSSDEPDAVAAFVVPGADAAGEEVFVASGHPLGAPSTQVAAHQRDFTTAVLAQGDRLGGMVDPGGRIPAVSTGGSPVSPADLLVLARSSADALRAAAGPARPVLLSVVEWSLPDGIAATLLATLVAGGTLVQCPRSWAAERLAATARAERVTATLGVSLAGLPALPLAPRPR